MHFEVTGDGAKIFSDVCTELQQAINEHQLFTSAHHGYAIILEELDELWDEIKKKRFERDIKNMRAEAVQVAAMAMKFIMSMENEWKPEVKEPKNVLSDEQLLENEVKCRACRYDVLTIEELSKIGHDPCDSCDASLSNWKPKEDKADDRQ